MALPPSVTCAVNVMTYDCGSITNVLRTRKAGLVAVVERQRRLLAGARRRRSAGAAVRYERAVHHASALRVRKTQRERSRHRRRQPRRNQIGRLALMVGVVQQRPVFNTPPRLLKTARTRFVVTTMSRSEARRRWRLPAGHWRRAAARVAVRRRGAASDGVAPTRCPRTEAPRPARWRPASGPVAADARYAVRTRNDRTTARRTRFSMKRISSAEAVRDRSQTSPSGWQRASRRTPSHMPSTTPCVRNGVGHVGRARRMKPAGAGEERREQQLVGAQRAKRQAAAAGRSSPRYALAHRAVPRSRHTPTRGC